MTIYRPLNTWEEKLASCGFDKEPSDQLPACEGQWGCYLLRAVWRSRAEPARPPARPYLFVVLLEVSELLTQGFVLNLQVGSAQCYFIQNSAQPVDISLHALVESQLIFVPSKVAVMFSSLSPGWRRSPIMGILQTQDFWSGKFGHFCDIFEVYCTLAIFFNVWEVFDKKRSKLSGTSFINNH